MNELTMLVLALIAIGALGWALLHPVPLLATDPLVGGFRPSG